MSTWSLSQYYKIYTSPTWQLTLHGWKKLRLYKNMCWTADVFVLFVSICMQIIIIILRDEKVHTKQGRGHWKNSVILIRSARVSKGKVNAHFQQLRRLVVHDWLNCHLLVWSSALLYFQMAIWTFAVYKPDSDHNNHSSQDPNPRYYTPLAFPVLAFLMLS